MRDTWRRYVSVADYVGLSLVLAGLIAFFGLTTDHFFTITTLRTIANHHRRRHDLCADHRGD